MIRISRPVAPPIRNSERAAEIPIKSRSRRPWRFRCTLLRRIVSFASPPCRRPPRETTSLHQLDLALRIDSLPRQRVEGLRFLGDVTAIIVLLSAIPLTWACPSLVT